MMHETQPLKLIPLPGGKMAGQRMDALFRFKGVILNLTGSALDCLNRVTRQEMEKASPSPPLMEEYCLLHHYLDFIKRFCQEEPVNGGEKKTGSAPETGCGP